MDDLIIIPNVEDEDGNMGELHVTGNKDGVSVDLVIDGDVAKSVWWTISDLLEEMQ